jgi:superfamily II DNA helicase RecQ
LPLMKHTVSQSGHDFRPEYIKLSVLKDRFANIPRLALTATADDPPRKDIMERLDLKEGRLFISGLDRLYKVLETLEKGIKFHMTPINSQTT